MDIDEGGFQIWGDDSSAPSDYFWGRTARSMAYDTLRWFARGGTHLNYYMWWGGSNRGRATAAGIMNAYATDAPVCSSGQRREPKFSHFQALHEALHRIAPILLYSPTALKHSIHVESLNRKGDWEYSGKQRMFVYHQSTDDSHDHSKHYKTKKNKQVVFVENDAKNTTVVRIELGGADKEAIIIEMNPFSALLIVDGSIKFDSFVIDSDAMSFERKIEPSSVDLMGWSSCAEPIGASSDDPVTIVQPRPVEQTALNIDAEMYTDYAWYERDFDLEGPLEEESSPLLFVESQKGSAIVLFVDGVFQGEAYNRRHAEGNVTFQWRLDSLSGGNHTLTLLSESLGYHNLIGRWGVGTKAKTKGVTGDVILSSSYGNMSLADGSGGEWRSYAGLHGSAKGYCREVKSAKASPGSLRPTWSSVMFNTPAYDPAMEALYLNITSGRGHLWLNGHDLGRFWNITRGETDVYSQQYYFLPHDLLESDGSVNNIVFFDALGSDLSSSKLVLSWLEHTDRPNLQDQVDYPLACI
jgi:beta-galactosidase